MLIGELLTHRVIRVNSLVSGVLRCSCDFPLFHPLSRQQLKPTSTLPSHPNFSTFFAVACGYCPNSEALQAVYFAMRGGKKMKWRVYVMLRANYVIYK